MPDYTMRDNGGEPASCDSCDFPAPLSEFRGDPGRPSRLLCEFCSTTMASRYTEYPSADLFIQLRAETWRAAACVFNATKFGLQTADGVPVAARTWQHDETGRITQTAECPGPRWTEVPAGVGSVDGGQKP